MLWPGRTVGVFQEVLAAAKIRGSSERQGDFQPAAQQKTTQNQQQAPAQVSPPGQPTRLDCGRGVGRGGHWPARLGDGRGRIASAPNLKRYGAGKLDFAQGRHAAGRKRRVQLGIERRRNARLDGAATEQAGHREEGVELLQFQGR